jgi:alkaline phosphatase D
MSQFFFGPSKTKPLGIISLLALTLALACSSGSSSSPTGPQSPPAPSFTGAFEITSIQPSPGGLVTVRFSHPVDSRLAEDQSNFAIAGLPILGSRRGQDPQNIVLETDHQIPEAYLLTVKSLNNERGLSLSGANQKTFVGVGTPSLETISPSNSSSFAALLARSWTLIDDPKATNSAPSRWLVANQQLRQESNIYGGSGDSIPVVDRFGTYLVWQGQELGNGWIEATLNNGDDDAMGLILRYQNPDNYVRFEWERQRRRRRIVEVVGGQATELTFDNERFEQGQDYQVRFSVWDQRVAVFVDQQLILGARLSSASQKGHAGLYCWGSNDLTIKNVVIQKPSAPLQASNAPFPQRPDAPLSTHGVSSSGLNSNGALLWVRGSEAAKIVFQLSTEPRFVMPLELPAVTVSNATDFTTTVQANGLLPQTRYYFRAILSDPTDLSRHNSSETGQFMTFPEPQKAADLVFAFAADFHGAVPSRFPILDHIVARQPDFLMMLGDFPYTDSSPAARTLSEYRTKHRRIRSYDQIKTLFANVPIFPVWDDHEVRNNWDGSTSQSRIDNGVKAWKEYFTHRPTAGANGGIYRKISFGQSAEIFILDTRFYRPDNDITDGPGKSMLGVTQKQWFFTQLAASKARYKIVITSVPLRHGSTASDHWKGYTHERTEIFDFIKAQTISRVFFLAGDQHWAAVHHHREGPTEVQVGPISVGVRTPPSSTPAEVVYRRATHSYGLVRIDGAAGLCFIELYDSNDKLLHSEVIP